MADEGTEHWAGEDADLQQYADTKGFKGASDALVAYKELETKQGSMVTIPKGDADDEVWEKFTGKLRPRNADAYADKPPEGLPEDTYDETLAAVMKQAAHEAGIPPRSFSKLWGKYWDAVGSQLKELDTKAKEIKDADEKTLRDKWKGDYDANIKISDESMEKNGAMELLKQFGLDTHPVMRHVFHQLALASAEMQPAGGGSEDETGEKPWHGGYPELKNL